MCLSILASCIAIAKLAVYFHITEYALRVKPYVKTHSSESLSQVK